MSASTEKIFSDAADDAPKAEMTRSTFSLSTSERISLAPALFNSSARKYPTCPQPWIETVFPARESLPQRCLAAACMARKTPRAVLGEGSPERPYAPQRKLSPVEHIPCPQGWCP